MYLILDSSYILYSILSADASIGRLGMPFRVLLSLVDVLKRLEPTR